MLDNRYAPTTGVFILVTGAALFCVAGEPVPVEQLSTMALEAKQDFRPLTADDVEQKKRELQTAANGLERYLSTSTQSNAAAWKKYLMWDAMHEQLQKDRPDLRALQRIRWRFYRMHDGLELPRFRNVRDRLTNYGTAALLLSQAELEDSYKARLDALAEHLRAYAEAQTSEDALGIGRSLGWLDQAEQAEELVAAVRARYCRPNLLAQISERVIAAGIEEDIYEVEQIRQNILDTSMRGTACLSGRTALRLVPNTDRASFDILLRGQAHSNNVGYNGPVTIYSSAITQVCANKRIHVDAEGLHSQSAAAQCSTRSTISRIAARCPLVRKIAWKRARQSKSQAERIASGRAACRIERRFDGQAGELLGKARESFDGKFRDPLLRRDGFPNLLRFRTSNSHLYVESMRASPFQLAAPGYPPELDGDHDVALRVHDSLVGNFSETLIGGETLSDERLVELLEMAEIEVPDELKISPDKDPWSITFSRQQPLSAAFSAEGITLAVQGTRFTRGDQKLRAPIRISATYKLDQTDRGIELTRQGDVRVDYINRQRLSVQEVAMKTFLRNKFAVMFKPEIVGSGLVLPGRWAQAGRLQLSELEVVQGWLTLGWNQPTETDRVASVLR